MIRRFLWVGLSQKDGSAVDMRSIRAMIFWMTLPVVAFFILQVDHASASDTKSEYEKLIKAQKDLYEQERLFLQTSWAERLKGIWGEVLDSRKLFEREYTESTASEIDLVAKQVRVTGVGIGIKPEDALDEALFQAIEGMKRTLLGLRLEGYMTLGDVLKRSGSDWESKLDRFVNEHLNFDKNDIHIEERSPGFMVKMTVRIPISGGNTGDIFPSHGEKKAPGRSVEVFSQSLFEAESDGADISEAHTDRDKEAGLISTPRTDIAFTTGLIVDASGTDYLPCMHPSVISESGKVLYCKGIVDLDTRLKQGSAEWAQSVEDARDRGRVGNVPIIIKPLRISCNNELIISKADYKEVMKRDKKIKFLKNAKFVVVIGDN